MAGSPATPNKGVADASQLSSTATTSNVKHASLHEPSPASTYGDTAGSASIPVTPQEVLGQDPTEALANSMKAAAALDQSIQYISMSPRGAREAQSSAQADRRNNSIRTNALLLSSPSSSNGMAGRGAPLTASDKSSPTTSRHQEIMASPSWRRGEAFVRQSAGVDDPFISNRGGQGSSQGDGSPFRPREDRAGIQLSGDNAQAILPPNACVFVANLVSTKTDEQLEYSVTNAFQVFGNCYVKIRRDNKGMPFAFCQYENVADAQRAITCGRGMEVDGRACRTEVAKVNRSLYLSKVTGEPISEEEARQGFRDHHLYRLEQPRMPDEIRARISNRAFESPMSSQRNSPGYPRRPFISPQTNLRRDIDLCSIFVGNLPPNVNEEVLRGTFGAYGNVRNVEVVRKPSVNVNGVNIFAFIEYTSYEEATFATSRVVTLQGSRLRVERKESVDVLNRRDMSMVSGGSPRSLYIADNQEALAMLFQRGVSVGMANAAAQAHASPAAGYGSGTYSYYPQYNQSPYGPYVSPTTIMDGDSPNNAQTHGNLYIPPVMGQMGQMQYPSAPLACVQFPQYPQPLPARSNYQWPPLTGTTNNDTTSATPAATEAKN